VSAQDPRTSGFEEPSLPRSNGTLRFDAPWQARAHALAVLSVESLGTDWDAFRQHLIAAIDDDEQRPYWDSWVIALDEFLTERGAMS